MNKNFTVIINDDNEIYQFNFYKFVKKTAIYILTFVIFTAVFAVGTVSYFHYSADQIENKRVDMEVADSLAKIEEMTELSSLEELPLHEKILDTKISFENIDTLMQFIPNGSPIQYNGLSSKFGYRMHPTFNAKEFHRGVDMKAEMNTPVYATADSVVEFAGKNKKSGYGKLVILQHNYGFETYFGHLNEIVIKSGQFIKKGDLIAYSGNTGRSSGPHLHYEIRFASKVVDPLWFIKWNFKNYNEIFKKEKMVPWQSLMVATSNIKLEKQIRPLLQQIILSSLQKTS